MIYPQPFDPQQLRRKCESEGVSNELMEELIGMLLYLKFDLNDIDMRLLTLETNSGRLDFVDLEIKDLKEKMTEMKKQVGEIGTRVL